MLPKLRIRAIGALLVASATLATTGTAHAAGTYRHDDGTRETAVTVDGRDGLDTAWTSFTLPYGTAHGSTGATLWVYGQATDCDLLGGTQRLYPPGSYVVIYFDPCDVFPTGWYGWHGFDVPMETLRDGTNYFQVLDDFRDLTVTGIAQKDGHNARYGVDTSQDLYSTVRQRDAAGVHDIAGELMWYLEVSGAVASMAVTAPSTEFGTVDVGTTTATRTFTVRNDGLVTLHPSVAVTGDAGDFPVTNDTCTGALGTGASCSFQVAFAPSVAGSRYATLTVSDAAAPPRSFTLHGEGRTTTPPVTAFTTPDGAVLLPGESVQGAVTSTAAVAYERVTFTPVVPGQVTTSVQAVLSCDARGTSCSWSSEQLTPGRYRVTAYGVDVQGNVETAGPGIEVTVG